jgi:hypothetical protein
VDLRDDKLWQNNKQAQTDGNISANLPSSGFPSHYFGNFIVFSLFARSSQTICFKYQSANGIHAITFPLFRDRDISANGRESQSWKAGGRRVASLGFG